MIITFINSSNNKMKGSTRLSGPRVGLYVSGRVEGGTDDRSEREKGRLGPVCPTETKRRSQIGLRRDDIGIPSEGLEQEV